MSLKVWLLLPSTLSVSSLLVWTSWTTWFPHPELSSDPVFPFSPELFSEFMSLCSSVTWFLIYFFFFSWILFFLLPLLHLQLNSSSLILELFFFKRSYILHTFHFLPSSPSCLCYFHILLRTRNNWLPTLYTQIKRQTTLHRIDFKEHDFTGYNSSQIEIEGVKKLTSGHLFLSQLVLPSFARRDP